MGWVGGGKKRRVNSYIASLRQYNRAIKACPGACTGMVITILSLTPAFRLLYRQDAFIPEPEVSMTSDHLPQIVGRSLWKFSNTRKTIDVTLSQRKSSEHISNLDPEPSSRTPRKGILFRHLTFPTWSIQPRCNVLKANSVSQDAIFQREPEDSFWLVWNASVPSSYYGNRLITCNAARIAESAT